MKKLIALMCSLLLFSSCGIKFNYPNLSENLTKITSKSVLKSILVKNNTSGWYRPGGVLEDTMAMAKESSNTNTQVQGIDEADSVKTNGDFIVSVMNNTVYVITPDNDKIVKTFSFNPKEGEENEKSYWVNELYLTDTQLVIMGTVATYTAYQGIKPGARDLWWGWWGNQDTFIQVVELDDLSISSSYEMKGSYFTSRLSGSELIVITTQWQTLVYDAQNNAEVIDPTVTDEDGNVISSIDEGKAYILPYNQGSSFVNILKVDLTGAEDADLSSFLGWIQTVYMNADHLIIAQSRYEYNEATQIGTSWTDLLRFDVDTLSLKAEGSVKGYLLNQFSLDIHNGVLRAALTNWDKVATNSVYTFDLAINVLDSIQNLAENETIRSVRFLGDKGYMVTFEQIDPLFVLDLSNPQDIKVTGELKIPGFSTYLHPVSDTVLWGIAEDLEVTQVTENGNTWNSVKRFGVKISLFDVADPTKPTELVALNILGPSGYSEAQYNHKAIVFDNDRNLVYIPYADYRYDTWTCNEGEKCDYSFETGLKILRITETGVEVVTTIAISSTGDQNVWVNRSLWVGNKLYLMSNQGFMVYDRTTYEKLGTISY
jgi:inhibitor of cysteine peptidase